MENMLTIDKDVDYSEELYVGLQGGKPLSTTNYPKGFAVPNGDKAEHRKRKETVNKWAVGQGQYVRQPDGSNKFVPSAPYQGNVIKNIPTEGFSFGKSISRYRTDNKVFEVRDPRGFHLEIYTDNLMDILTNGKVDRGEILGQYVWGRKGGNVYLIDANRVQFNKPTPKKISTDIKVGDEVTAAYGYPMVYLGKVLRNYVDVNTKYKDDKGKYTWDYSDVSKNTNWSNYTQRVKDTAIVFDIFEDDKPWHLFGAYHGGKFHDYHIYRSIPKVKEIKGQTTHEYKIPANGEMFKVLSSTSTNQFMYIKEEKGHAFNTADEDCVVNLVKPRYSGKTAVMRDKEFKL